MKKVNKELGEYDFSSKQFFIPSLQYSIRVAPGAQLFLRIKIQVCIVCHNIYISDVLTAFWKQVILFFIETGILFLHQKYSRHKQKNVWVHLLC